MDDYIRINRNSWNAKVAYHLDSEFYDMPAFLTGKTSLPNLDIELLGDINGQSVLHLQCHFGQDSISLARLGAQVVGVDLSDKAIDAAKQIAEDLSCDAQFICCDVYDLPKHLYRKFDLVYTSYGAIGWLPDLNRWAEVVSHFLKPGGSFVFVEFHPFLWVFDDDFRKIKYPYSSKDPIVEVFDGTYADTSAPIQQVYVMWNHSLSDVFHALRVQKLSIQHFEEHTYSPWPCFKDVSEFAPQKFIVPNLGKHFPYIYSIVATKQK